MTMKVIVQYENSKGVFELADRARVPGGVLLPRRSMKSVIFGNPKCLEGRTADLEPRGQESYGDEKLPLYVARFVS